MILDSVPQCGESITRGNDIVEGTLTDIEIIHLDAARESTGDSFGTCPLAKRRQTPVDNETEAARDRVGQELQRCVADAAYHREQETPGRHNLLRSHMDVLMRQAAMRRVVVRPQIEIREGDGSAETSLREAGGRLPDGLEIDPVERLAFPVEGYNHMRERTSGDSAYPS